MQNRDIAPALTAFAEVCKKQIPITIAVRMAKCRRELEARARDIEAASNAAIARLRKVEDSGVLCEVDITPTHPNFIELRNELDTLYSIEFASLDIFELFVRTREDGEEEFCWTEGFQTACFTEFGGEIINGLYPLLDVKYV